MRIALRVATLLFFAACSENSSSPVVPVDAGGPSGDADAHDDATAPEDATALPETGNDDGAGSSDASGLDANLVGGSRPVSVHVPPGYVSGVPAPLVIMLHGYSASGALEESYLQLTTQSDARGFLYAYPDGTIDPAGEHFWNATDACCNIYNSMVDDSAYLSALITEIQARYTVDPKKVFLFGHSNGGFMSYRMACDHADQIAAIVSLAGAMFADVTRCAAKEPVNILEIHGTADTVISYAGGMIQGTTYPGATTTVGDWATIDSCASTPDTSSAPLDLDSALAGAETKVTTYAAGCKPGGHAELWTIEGGSHIPSLSPTFSSAAIDFLLAHAKP